MIRFGRAYLHSKKRTGTKSEEHCIAVILRTQDALAVERRRCKVHHLKEQAMINH